MKSFIVALCIFLVIIIFITAHSVIMFDLTNEISSNCKTVISLAHNEKWDEVVKGIDRIQNIWNKRRIWAALTISTEEIEQIEISLSQSRIFAELNQKPDFFGEFTMFTMLLEHIPHQEGFHIAEIL